MKGKLIIGGSRYNTTFQTEVYKDNEPYGYEVSINVPLEDDFISLISKPYDFDESIQMRIETQDDEIEIIKFLEDFKQKRLDYLKNAEYIIFNAYPSEIAEYIRKNPILKTKKIIFEDFNELDSTLVNEIDLAFGSEISNIYFNLVGNSDLITFKEYKGTIDAITKMINEIEKFNFSPMEKIMYAYDIVRNKVYVEVDENEDKMLSRNLTSSLLGDKIVCVGYARIFKTLLLKLGIKCREVHFWNDDRQSGHARNLIYVQDEKYGINGIYYFDPTWGSKEDENDNEYLYSYRYFAMTKDDMDEIDEGDYVDVKMPYPINKILFEFENKFNKFGWDKMPEDIINQINYMGYLVDRDTIIEKSFIMPFAPPSLKPTKESVVEKISPLLEYFNRTINAETMLQILYNVRKMQFYTTPDKFPFGMNEFFKTVFMSHWEFKGTQEENLLMELLDSPKEKGRIKLRQFSKYASETDLQREIETVKLAKVLRNTYELEKQKTR